MTTILPDDLTEELNRDAQEAGYMSKRTDKKGNRWEYLRKCMALGRKYIDVIRF